MSALDLRGMLDYARVAHDLLNYPLGQVGRYRLRAAYQSRIRELGFGGDRRYRRKPSRNT